MRDSGIGSITIGIYDYDRIIENNMPRFCPVCGGEVEYEVIEELSAFGLEIVFYVKCNECGWSGFIKPDLLLKAVGNIFL